MTTATKVSLEDLDMLTPGAVYIRANSSKRYVLFLTNSTLTGDKALKHPQRVVFANDQNEIFCIPVEDFIASSKFYNVSASLESKLDLLLIFNDEDPTEEDFSLSDNDATDDFIVSDEDLVSSEDQSTEVMSALSSTSTEFNVPASYVETVKDYPSIIFNYNSEDYSGKPAIDANLLSEMLYSYSQEPNLSVNAIYHKLTFKLPINVSVDAIKACFDINTTVEDLDRPFYTSFNLNPDVFGEADSGLVDWNHSIGAFKCLENGNVMLNIILAENFEQPSEDFEIPEDIKDIVEELNPELEVQSATA